MTTDTFDVAFFIILALENIVKILTTGPRLPLHIYDHFFNHNILSFISEVTYTSMSHPSILVRFFREVC